MRLTKYMGYCVLTFSSTRVALIAFVEAEMYVMRGRLGCGLLRIRVWEAVALVGGNFVRRFRPMRI